MNAYLKPIAASLFIAFAAPSMAATATWSFDLPSTGLASQDPPYPSVTTVTLTDVAGGVQFVLDPAETNPGYTDNSTVNRLDYGDQARRVRGGGRRRACAPRGSGELGAGPRGGRGRGSGGEDRLDSVLRDRRRGGAGV